MLASIAPTDFGRAAGVGGLFAQSSNIGSTTHGRFSVVPQVLGSLSYEINCHLKFSAGYNFIYWTDVERPGNQIDRNINPNLAPVFGGSAAGVGAALAGAAEPAVRLLGSRRELWNDCELATPGT